MKKQKLNYMASKNLKAIQKAVAAARKDSPVANDPQLQYVKKGKVGSPVMIHTQEGEPAYWFVPILIKDSACGFARVELSGIVSHLGTFGAGYEDRSSWIKASFFEKPPPEILNEIKNRYPGLKISKPFFSYDKSPSKWAWRLEVRSNDKVSVVIFISPSGWYEQTPEKKNMELEG